MKCCVLLIRTLRRRCFLYIVTMLFIIYIFNTFQSVKYISLKTILYNLPYWKSSSLFVQLSFGNGSLYFPGSFLRSIKPSNESYCSFRLGFPDFFDLADSEILLSPELGKRGTYRVIYNVLQGSWTTNQTNSVTYCSHLTPDFIYFLSEIVVRWEGPVSIAAFVPGYDASTTLCLLQRLCYCVPDMSKVSLHFVFPINYPPDHVTCNPSLLVPLGCSMPTTILKNRLNTFRKQKSLTYPVNVARNVARISAKTKFVVVSDIELFPSKRLASRFQKLVQTFQLKLQSTNIPFNQTVYVLPVFEIEHYILSIPENKSELLALYAQNKAVYFHRWICLHCQRFPGLQRWIHKSSNLLDNTIQPLLVVRREFPFHRWEPIYIGTNNEPLYSELLTWEGKQDKMIQMHEMCLRGYRFVILDGAFLVHAPGIKRRGNVVGAVQEWSEDQSAHYFNNMQHYDGIMKNITKQLGRRKGCKLY